MFIALRRKRLTHHSLAGMIMAMAVGCSGGGGWIANSGTLTGLWQPTAVTEVVTCNGQATTRSVTDNLTWATSASNPDEIVSTGPCTLTLTVNGNTATITGSESCPVQTSNGTTIVITLNNYSFTSNDDKSATVTANGIASVSGINCTFNETGSYQKIATGT